MTSVQPIPDLNDYCLRHIFSFLETLDQVNVAKASEQFRAIVEQLIPLKCFDFNNIYECRTIAEATEIFTEFGHLIKNIFMQFDAVEEMVEFYYLVPNKCHNLEKIHYNFPYYVDTELMEMMFETSKNVRSLYCNARELYDGQSKLISQLTKLESLNIEENRDVTGLHLSKLINLKELNMQGCTGLEPKHFIDICKATKLKKLNIIECELLDKTAFETLIETQTELEEIKVSCCYANGNVEIVSLLPKLKHITIHFLCRKSHDECEFLNMLAKYHHDSLETLELYRPNKLPASRRAAIWSLTNLTKITFIGDEVLDNAFVSELSRKCQQLKEIDISECRTVTAEAIVEVVKNLPKLRYLDLRRCGQIEESLYQKLVDVLQGKENPTSLLVFAWGTEMVERPLTTTEKYISNRKYVELSFRFKF